jgi:hypothetical protein
MRSVDRQQMQQMISIIQCQSGRAGNPHMRLDLRNGRRTRRMRNRDSVQWLLGLVVAQQ